MTARPLAIDRPPSIVRPSLVYLLAFSAVGSWVPYWSVFVQSLGMQLGTIGLLVAVAAAVGILAAPLWGSLADRLGDVRPPLLIAALWSAAMAAALFVTRDPLLVSVEVVLLAVGTAGMTPLIDTRTVEVLGTDRHRFGRARAWGSAAFIVASLVTGVIVARVGPGGLFTVYAPALLLTGLAGAVLLGRGSGRMGSARVDPARRRALFRDRRLLRFFIGSVALWGANSAILTFFSIRLVDLGADGRLLGLAWGVNALVEVPLMLAFPALAKRFGAERLVVVGAAAFVVRALAWAVTADAAASVAVATIGGVGFAFVYVGTVTYVAAVAPPGMRATAQAIFTGTAYGLGTILGSSLGGAFAAAFGLPWLFAVGAAVMAIAGTIVWSAIGRGAATVPAGGSPIDEGPGPVSGAATPLDRRGSPDAR